MEIKSAYSPKLRVQLTFTTKGRTKQAFKDECDINKIMARYIKTGTLEFATRNEGRYGDCTGMQYEEACYRVAAAKSLFNELPAELRNRFDNEPGQFLAFVQDDRNRAEAQELGLLKPVEAPAKAEATPPPPPPPPRAPAAPPHPTRAGKTPARRRFFCRSGPPRPGPNPHSQ